MIRAHIKPSDIHWSEMPDTLHLPGHKACLLYTSEKTIRFDLGKKVRNQLRIIPELRFFLDDSLDYLEHIDELLKK